MAVVRKAAFALAATAALACGTVLAAGGASAAGIAFSTQDVGAFGGEPSITSDSNGVLYDTTPSGPQTYRSNDAGATWTTSSPPTTTAATTASRRPGQLAVLVQPGQHDQWATRRCRRTCGSPPPPTSRRARQLQLAVGQRATTAGTCSTSCNPFGVDRQWVTSSITGVAPSTDTAHALVVLMYHDFYGPSHIWVNVSTDGGATFGTAEEVLSERRHQQPDGHCHSRGLHVLQHHPGGCRHRPPGKPHAGRIFVSWIASDLAQDATGCNISMAQSFHTAWIAYSDDKGQTWTPQMAFDSGIGHDMSTPFVAFTLDGQGNPYIAFDSQAPGQNPATCCRRVRGRDSPVRHHLMRYNMYVVWSPRWRQHVGRGQPENGQPAASRRRRGGVPGEPHQPRPARTSSRRSRPATRARWTSRTSTPTRSTPTDPARQVPAAGLRRARPASYPNYPPRCHWNLETAQSLNLTNPPGDRDVDQRAGHDDTDALRRHLQPRHRVRARRHPDPHTSSTSSRRRSTRRPAARISATPTTTL